MNKIKSILKDKKLKNIFLIGFLANIILIPISKVTYINIEVHGMKLFSSDLMYDIIYNFKNIPDILFALFIDIIFILIAKYIVDKFIEFNSRKNK